MRTKTHTPNHLLNAILSLKSYFIRSSVCVMSKEQLPTLTGQKFKTRTRDKKVKYDPEGFSEAIITKINESAGNVEVIAANLDKEGEKQDYRRYAETLFDILIAGGMLSPGGVVSENPTEYCVFNCDPASIDAVKGHVGILVGLLRRYRYLQKNIEEELKKVITYMKQFSEEQRKCLAIYTALCISEGIVLPYIIKELFSDHLSKDENLSLAFATTLFSVWLNEKSISHVGSGLRKANLEFKLLNILPAQKRRNDVFDGHFKSAGLDQLVEFRIGQQSLRIKRKLKEEIDEHLKNNSPVADIIEHCQETVQETDHTLSDVHVTVILWKSLMSAIEWNKKEDLLAEQALRHLQTWSDVFKPFCEQGTAQLTLLIQIQEYCYENMSFMKVFHKIILLLYNNDILSEQAILKWYKDSHIAKGKSVFLPQMKKMVDWLETAEEESD